MSRHQIVLYGRPGCCLCDEAREVLERVRAGFDFELSEQNIETDQRLLRAYLERIPVVTVDGREAFELFVDEDALRAVLRGPEAGSEPQ